ncbi:hypothetical protein [Phormidesmis priestleyi]
MSQDRTKTSDRFVSSHFPPLLISRLPSTGVTLEEFFHPSLLFPTQRIIPLGHTQHFGREHGFQSRISKVKMETISTESPLSAALLKICDIYDR